MCGTLMFWIRYSDFSDFRNNSNITSLLEKESLDGKQAISDSSTVHENITQK
jgi:hypothetical protein